MSDLHAIQRAAAEAECLYTGAHMHAAVDAMAQAITQKLGDTNPILLGIMQGGVVLMGALLLRLKFPLQIDYVHATRYRGTTSGGELHWIHPPPPAIAGRTVLLVDDILDGGQTLAALVAACRQMGAAQVMTAVVVEKTLARTTLAHADFAAVTAPDRYLFGWGMDYQHYWRNLDGIYALKESN